MTPLEDSTRTGSTGWSCGHCGDLITRIEDGWVEWIAAEDASGNEHLSGFRLVHRHDGSTATRTCQYDQRVEFAKNHSIVEGLSLERFVGTDGLMLLLSFLAQSSASTGEILELTKRVQIPGYELVRQRIYPALAAGYFHPAISDEFPLQSEIAGVLHWAYGPGTSMWPAA
jgi:hypothetical protein